VLTLRSNSGHKKKKTDRDCNSHVDNIESSIGTVCRCQNAHRLQPQAVDTETQERLQVATVDGWQHYSLARKGQLAVPGAHVLKFLAYCYRAMQQYPVFLCAQRTVGAP